MAHACGLLFASTFTNVPVSHVAVVFLVQFYSPCTKFDAVCVYNSKLTDNAISLDCLTVQKMSALY